MSEDVQDVLQRTEWPFTDTSRSVDAVDLSPYKLKKRDAALDSQADFSVTSSRLRSKEETDVWRFGFFPFVLIDRVEVCMAEKGYRYGVFFAARNESELEGRAFLCGQKRQRTRDPPLGSCTCRAREPVPIPVQNGARVSCKWRIERNFAKFQDQGFIRSKVKMKRKFENFENEDVQREKANFMYNFVQKPMHLTKFDCSFCQLPEGIFSQFLVFTHRSV